MQPRILYFLYYARQTFHWNLQVLDLDTYWNLQLLWFELYFLVRLWNQWLLFNLSYKNRCIFILFYSFFFQKYLIILSKYLCIYLSLRPYIIIYKNFSNISFLNSLTKANNHTPRKEFPLGESKNFT